MLGWKSRALAAAIGISAVFIGAAQAEQYPSRAVSIVAPVAPGAPFDLLGRLFADRLRQKLAVPVIMQNATGGNGLIATQKVAGAKGDGYTFLLASTGLATAPFTMSNAGYSPSDFVAVAPLGQAPYVLLTSAAVPATDIGSLIAYLKAQAKDINYGVLTASDASTLLARKLGSMADIELTTVGYRGSTAMLAALLANEIQVMATTYSVAGAHIEAGKIKAIGTLGDERMRQLPDVPTFREKGFPDLKVNVWAGLFARADTPPEILSKVRDVAREIVADPTYLKAMEATGMDPWSIPFESLQAYVEEDAKAFKIDAERFKLKPN